ncbi:hypothetical protein SLUN_23250 [Streptomyces lunaelactis]|uniref:Uncharacterized protein n=1 Tax=Streptomyces lunaelactis TaxID=1535768 RepID=A0A2R4TEQ9_9ACTN|nr:hypothetical protein SLUN_23250 [Streptomyces lunaelactis]
MADTWPAATVVGCCAFSKTVHIVRLDLPGAVDGVGASAGAAGVRAACPSRTVSSFLVPLRPRYGPASVPPEPPSAVIFPSTAAHTLRARLDASCSLVSLAVQSLRSM